MDHARPGIFLIGVSYRSSAKSRIISARTVERVLGSVPDAANDGQRLGPRFRASAGGDGARRSAIAVLVDVTDAAGSEAVGVGVSRALSSGLRITPESGQ